MARQCVVCGKDIVGSDFGECDRCYQPYHLALTQTSQTEDCGVIFLDPEILGLRHLCANCAKEEFPPDGVPLLD